MRRVPNHQRGRSRNRSTRAVYKHVFGATLPNKLRTNKTYHPKGLRNTVSKQKTIKNASKDVGKDVKNASKDVGNDVKDAADDVGKDVRDAAQEITGQTRKPSEQALQVLDVAVGAVPEAADAVTRAVDQPRDPEARSQEVQTLQNRADNLRDPSTRDAQVETLKRRITAELEKAEARGGEIRHQVTDQIVEQARKARDRVEPVYRDRVEPVYKERFEPTVKSRVEPVYRDRVEPTVKRVRERI